MAGVCQEKVNTDQESELPDGRFKANQTVEGMLQWEELLGGVTVLLLSSLL